MNTCNWTTEELAEIIALHPEMSRKINDKIEETGYQQLLSLKKEENQEELVQQIKHYKEMIERFSTDGKQQWRQKYVSKWIQLKKESSKLFEKSKTEKEDILLELELVKYLLFDVDEEIQNEDAPKLSSSNEWIHIIFLFFLGCILSHFIPLPLIYIGFVILDSGNLWFSDPFLY